MKKIIPSLIILGLWIGIGNLYAETQHPIEYGIGVQFNYGTITGFFGNDLSIKLPNIPIFWTVGSFLDYRINTVRLAGDWYYLDKKIVGPLGWYLGVGLCLNFDFGENYFGLWPVLRIPIGLSVWTAPKMEIFLQAVPNIVVNLIPYVSKSYNGIYAPIYGIDANLGIRFWITNNQA